MKSWENKFDWFINERKCKQAICAILSMVYEMTFCCYLRKMQDFKNIRTTTKIR